MILLQLFWSYLKIGFFGFGGGYAMLSLIQNEIVVQNQWITNAQLTDIVAISQMTPGPIAINSATYVGYTVAGFWGSVVATIAVCMPAMTMMVVVTKFFFRLRHNIYVETIMKAMHPVVIGMIGAAVLLLMFPSTDDGASFIDPWSWAIFAAAIVGALRKVNLLVLIALSAVAGILIYYVPTLFA
ncbi:MAG: chromate transporter [Rikenellaceae bacterium]